MDLHGKQLLSGARSAEGPADAVATNPASGEALPGRFYRATPGEIESAAQAATTAATALARKSPGQIAALLE